MANLTPSSKAELLEVLRLVGRLAGIRESVSKQYDPIVAPRFNSLALFGIDENTLSRILGFFLNPVGHHAQGDCFLNILLDEFAVMKSSIGEITSVETEFTIDNNRRIDLMAIGTLGVIAIENKPWATDQPDQLRDYLDFLQRRHPNKSTLIYLTPDGTEPGQNSLSHAELVQAILDGRLILGSYRTLRHVVDKFAERCASERVRWFAKELSRYIDNAFLEYPMMDYSLVVDAIRSDPRSLRSACDILAAKAQLQDRLLEKFKSQLAAIEMPASLQKIRIVPGRFDPMKQYFAWEALLTGFEGFRVLFEFTRSQCRGLCWGVCGSSEFGKMSDPEVSNFLHLKQLLEASKLGMPSQPGLPSSTEWWPWMQTFPIYPDWTMESDAWIALDSGEMKRLFEAKIFQIGDALAGG